MGNKELVYSTLDAKGISYAVMEHEAVYTMEDMDRVGITARGIVCKNLFLRDAKGREHYLVTVPEGKRVDLRALAEKIGSTKLSFASAERLEKYLGVTEGSVSPLGILNDESKSVIVVFDKELRGKSEVGIHPNDNTATVWLAFSDLLKLIDAHGNEVLYADFERYAD